MGGFLARLAYPTVVADGERKTNPNAKADEAWGWLPPPLIGEGRKVQTEWLHDFLLDPYLIRPAVVLRMPKFNMSSDEATKLVNYFAAVDGVDYPYEFDPRTREAHLAEAEVAASRARLSDALKIVTDNNYCIKCHLLGDFAPAGSESAQAPQLDDVYATRSRPNFALDWIANPKRISAVHRHAGEHSARQAGQPGALFKGDSEQQLNAVVDLLLNYRSLHGKQDFDQATDQDRQPPQKPSRRQPIPEPGRGAIATTTRSVKRREPTDTEPTKMSCYHPLQCRPHAALGHPLATVAAARPATPPPGAPESADAPKIDQGEEGCSRQLKTARCRSDSRNQDQRRRHRSEDRCRRWRMGHAQGPHRVRRQGSAPDGHRHQQRRRLQGQARSTKTCSSAPMAAWPTR